MELRSPFDILSEKNNKMITIRAFLGNGLYRGGKVGGYRRIWLEYKEEVSGSLEES